MTTYRTLPVDGINIFYREAGPADAPVIVLLHGYPSSSHMYEGLMRELAGQFHLIAPDYPGFGSSDSPSVEAFRYSFDALTEVTEHFLQALNLTHFSLYLQDYGAPIGLRIAAKHPEWIETLIIQDGNAYEEGLTAAFDPLRAFWKERSATTEAGVRQLLTPEIVTFFYMQGTRHPEQINPDNFILDRWSLQRPGNHEAHVELFYDYRTNVEQYPIWHTYFQQHQPPTLVVWGKNDPFFSTEGAHAFERDLKTIEVHLFDTGHFALEEDGDKIAALIARFVPAHLARQ